MAIKRATNSEVNSKIGSSLTPSTKCPTKAEVVATGKGTVSSYSDSQLVDLDNVNKNSIVITFRVDPIEVYYADIGGNLELNGSSYPISANSDGKDYSVELNVSSVKVSAFINASIRKSQMGSLQPGSADPNFISEIVTGSKNYWIRVTSDSGPL
jgi:hypothetical protein